MLFIAGITPAVQLAEPPSSSRRSGAGGRPIRTHGLRCASSSGERSRLFGVIAQRGCRPMTHLMCGSEWRRVCWRLWRKCPPTGERRRSGQGCSVCLAARGAQPNQLAQGERPLGRAYAPSWHHAPVASLRVHSAAARFAAAKLSWRAGVNSSCRQLLLPCGHQRMSCRACLPTPQKDAICSLLCISLSMPAGSVRGHFEVQFAQFRCSAAAGGQASG